MESPLNKKIQRSLERTAAKKKKDSNYVPVLTLRQQVLSLVTEANKSAQSERQVTPRSALIVMDRALASLAVVDEESRDFAVLREVSSFISTTQKTSVMTASAHTDLLPQGHPLSALNASLTPEEYRFKYAQWLAADGDVSSAARPLVAAAFSAKPGSIERNHAFMRLSVTTEKVPGYFKLDPAPIIAAFSDGNSSAARRARVALQWRDKKGRWVEMGRGANFRYRTSDGGVASASGVYVGVRPKQPGDNYTAGLIQVSGDKNLPDGIYAVRPSNAETYSARIPTEALKKAGITPGATPSQSMVGVPSQDEILATRKDAPEGWKKNSDNTFTSDDNYTVKGGDGEYTLYRQNEDGSLGDKVGEAANWAEINELANNDQDAYDEVKGQASSPEAREQVKARIATRTKHNEEFDRLEELVKSGVDQNGNKVPEGWEGIVRPGRAAFIERRAIGADRVIDEEGLPSVEYRKAIAYDYDTEPVYAEASYDLTGKFAAYDKRYDSWEEAEADIPRWIAAEEKRRDRKLEPIATIPSEAEGKTIKLPDGYSLVQADNPLSENIKLLNIKSGDEVVGFVAWDKDTKVVENIKVDAAHRGKKLAQAAWAEVKKIEPGLQHSEYRTPDGDRFAHSTGDYVPPLIPMGDWTQRDLDEANARAERAANQPPQTDYRAGFFDKDGNRLPGPPSGDSEDRPLTPEQAKRISDDIKIPVLDKLDKSANPFAPSELPDQRAGYFDKDGNRLLAPDNVIKPPKDLAVGDEVYIPNVGWRKVKRVSKDEKRLEGRKKTLPLYRVEYEDEDGKTGTWKWTPFSEDGQGNKIKGLETRTPIEEQLSPLTEEQNKKIDAEIRDLIKNPPAPTEMDKRVEKLLQEQRAEWDKAKEDNYARIFDEDVQPLPRKIGGQDDYLGPVKTKQLNDEFRKELEEKNRKSDAQAKDIYDRRMAGESLDKVAKDLGLTREEVRYIEAKYARQNEQNKNNKADSKKSYTVDFALDSDSYDEIGLDPEKDYTDEEIANAWIKSKNLDGKVEFVKADNPSGQWPEFTFKIDENSKDAFAEAYGYDSWSDLNDDQQFDNGDGDGPDEPPTGGGSNTPGSGFSDYVIDLASGGTDPDKDLQERLDEDVEELAVDFMENIYEDAGDVYELSEDIKDNKPEGMSDKEFIDDAAAQMRKNLEAIVDSAIGDRNDFVESGDAEPVDFDKETFISIAIERYKELVQEELNSIREDEGDDDGDGPDEPPTPPSGGGGEPPAGMKLDFADPEQAAEDAGLPEDTPFNEIVKAWFDQNIKPVAPTAKLDGFEEGGPDGPSVRVSAGNEEDLLNAFRVYFGDDEATLEDLRDHSEEYSAPGKGKDYTVDFAMDQEDYGDIGLDPEKDYTPEEIANAWIKTNGLEGKVTFAGAVESNGMWPEMSFNIPDEYKDAFAEAYGYDSWADLNEDAELDGPDEPPTPPSGGTPPKTPSPSTPSAPSLYKEFDVPNGAFELRGVDYEPEGRVDERSSDFTDDPERLATKFSVEDLIAAFSEAILGNSSDASVAEILNANVGDDDEIDAPSEVDVNVNMPQVALGSPSGAGRLEFNAGEEFVLAESLFNALWHAGVDPNRVLANLYDSVNGDNKNLSKLIEAQGGTPSPEEAQLVDDITAEIRQIKDATPDGEPSIANQKNEPSEELQGSLIENVAIDFENPDYYIPDSSAYVPSQEEPDENGYTDNPQILATDYEEADLIMQMLEGITDGSGAALLNFGDITTEVPIEAIRDALQLQGINTNDILVDLKRESNDMSEPETTPEARRFPPTTGERQAIERPVNPRLQAHSQMIKDLIEQTGNTIDDDTADKIRDAIDDDWGINWSEATDEEIIEAIVEVAGPGILGREAQEDITPTPPSPVSPPQSGDRQPYKPEEVTIEGEQSQPADVPVDSPEYETPQYSYPGPREAGYTPNNVVLDSNGAAVGAGARVQALSDGRAGTVLAVQNIDTKSGRDADYVRIRFDDGTTAVRSARQIFGIDAGAPLAQGEGPGQLPPSRPNPVPQDPGQRFNEPAPAGTPVIAGDGSIPGVSLVDTPDDVAEFVNPDAKQADFAAWGLRAPEIARAGRERADVKNLVDLIEKEKAARVLASEAPTEEERNNAKAERGKYEAQIKKLIGDSFGIRPGVKFGKNNYSIGDGARIDYTIFDSGEVNFSIAFSIQDERGRRVGEGSRTVRGLSETDVLGNTTRKWVVSNNLLKIYDKKDKKSGFASAYNRYMEDWYIANGFSSISVFAAGGGGWDGGFVWAVNGFNWKGSQANTVPTILRSMLRKPETSDEEKQIINRMLDRIAKDNPSGNYTPDTVPTPLEIAMIGWYPGATNWIGKKQMKSMGWYGEKRLDPQAIEQRQAINYNQSRNALKRVKDKENRAGVSRDLVLKMNSNEFADANPELAPYIDQIRDVLRSNRSLAVLSPAAKTALNRFTASQLLKGEDRSVALQDIFKLRTALDAEFKADNPLAGSKDFGVGNQLLDVSIDDVNANRVPGFTVRRLGMYESGINETFMLTHNDSGQIFFVKKDSYAAQYQINGAGAEVQADVMLRASGVVAGYEARVSNVDDEIIVMQRAGAGVPLLGEPMTASNAIGNKLSINLPDGTTVKVNASNFMDLLHTPEDAVRVMLVDLIISNMDRHNGNLLLAVDGTDTGKIRLLPIDHALSSFSPDTEGMQFTVQELFDNSFDNLYGMAMPVLTKRLKQEELLDLFKNEARIMMQELNNPANLPTGKELDLIIKNFGSVDAYRQKIQERIDSLLTPGNEGYQTFLSVLKPSYWSTR